MSALHTVEQGRDRARARKHEALQATVKRKRRLSHQVGYREAAKRGGLLCGWSTGVPALRAFIRPAVPLAGPLTPRALAPMREARRAASAPPAMSPIFMDARERMVRVSHDAIQKAGDEMARAYVGGAS